MSELSGDKIMGLLWDEGFEVEHDEGVEEGTPIKVTAENSVILISEVWFEEGNWYADSDTLVLEKLVDGEKVGEDLDILDTEEELVDHIVRLAGA